MRAVQSCHQSRSTVPATSPSTYTVTVSGPISVSMSMFLVITARKYKSFTVGADFAQHRGARALHHLFVLGPTGRRERPQPPREQEYDAYRTALADVTLPAAFVDLDALEANIATVQGRAAGMRVRVASKSVRCRAILDRVTDADGIRDLMCYTGREPAHLHAHEFDDLLVAYPILDRAELDPAADAVADGADVTLMIDCDEQSMAGALATGTHGTGGDYGVIATTVELLRLVTADGAPRELTPADGEAFQAACVSLDTLGVVTEVTLSVRPGYKGRDSAFIACHRYHRKPHRAFLQDCAATLAPYDARPHWGKHHWTATDRLAELYPEWDTVQRVRREFDPDGRFLDGHLARVFEEGAPSDGTAVPASDD